MSGCAILCWDSKRRDSSPLNIEQASVKWNHLLLELASLNVSSTRRATDASRRVKASNMTG